MKKKLTGGKAYYADEITPEIPKYGKFYDIILTYTNKIITNSEKPEE